MKEIDIQEMVRESKRILELCKLLNQKKPEERELFKAKLIELQEIQQIVNAACRRQRLSIVK